MVLKSLMLEARRPCKVMSALCTLLGRNWPRTLANNVTRLAALRPTFPQQRAMTSELAQEPSLLLQITDADAASCSTLRMQHKDYDAWTLHLVVYHIMPLQTYLSRVVYKLPQVDKPLAPH